MALGAETRSVLRLVIGEAMILAGGGVIFGTVAALYVSRALSALLFEIQPGDPLTYAAAAGLLLTIALAASYLPARRATRVDPMIALRAE
jgi:ABC-type antimicrobial peptide transport system permease subunit